MQTLDTLLAPLIGTVVVLLGTINVYFLKKIKLDTMAVNNAVNHVPPGGATLTQRVDRIEKTLTVIQYDQTVAKDAAIETKTSSDKTNNVIDQLMAAHVRTNERLDALLLQLPKRNTD
jgi:hypothetical protein